MGTVGTQWERLWEHTFYNYIRHLYYFFWYVPTFPLPNAFFLSSLRDPLEINILCQMQGTVGIWEQMT